VSENETRIEVYLDDRPEPYATFVPPDRFELDATRLPDGRHTLRIIAIDASGHQGVRVVPFEVRNGPGIAVDGLRDHEIVEGKINVLVNAYGGAYEEKWEPARAETPAPVPTWAWVVFIVVVAWALYYGIALWRPPPQFADTPTYARRFVPPPKAKPAAGLGAELYRTSCASCHGENGQGKPGLFPPLAGDPVVNAADPAGHIRIVLFGATGSSIGGRTYSAHMPAWADQLSDEEVAAVINHERTNWGNGAPQVEAADVAKIRAHEAR
jgi:mono/diheme cytochrome c family protein